MTPQRAKELLPVIQAFAEGREIQLNWGTQSSPRWCDANRLSFEDEAAAYRIKPTPREWWIEVAPNGIFVQWCWKPNREKEHSDNEIIHVREVL